MFVFLAVIIIFGYLILKAVDKTPPLGGIDANAISYGYNDITDTSSTCAVAGNSLAVGTTTGRTSLFFYNASGTAVTLCKGLSCAATKGLYLLPVSTTTAGTKFYEQSDGYYGPWSCATVGSASQPGQVSYWQSK